MPFRGFCCESIAANATDPGADGDPPFANLGCRLVGSVILGKESCLSEHPRFDSDSALQESEIDVQALWRALVRRRWVAVGIWAACLAIGALLTIRSPRIFKARATILIDRAPPQVLGDVADVYDLGTAGWWQSREYYATQYAVIKSRPVGERVVAALGVEPKQLAAEIRALEPLVAGSDTNGVGGFPEGIRKRLEFLGVGEIESRDDLLGILDEMDAVEHIQGRILVEPLKESRLVGIAVEGTDPAQTAVLANAVSDAYIEFNLDQKISATSSAVDWLTVQLHELKERLRQSELALQGFKEKDRLVSVSLEERQSIVAQTLSQLNESLSTTKAERISLGSLRAQLAEAHAGGDAPDSLEDVIRNRLIQELKSTQSKLGQEYAELAVRYTADHPKVIAVKRKLKLVEADLNAEVDKVLQSLDQRYQAALATEAQLKASIYEAKSEALKLNKSEIEYTRLRRERDNNAALYDLVLKRRKEADLTRLLRVNNVRPLEAAVTPRVPIRPRTVFNMLVAFVFGLLGGIGLALLVDYLDNTLKTQEQIESWVGVPFLGLMPRVRSAKPADPVGASERDNYIVTHPRSSVAECCRTIRTNLLFMSPDQPLRKILITSSGPREGKSMMAINLAITMAQSGARTLVVDTDMRRPRLHTSFGLPNDVGVSTVIVGDRGLDEAIRSTSVQGVDLLGCGPIPPNPAELLHTDSFKNIVGEIESRYDRVVFDSPPVGAVSDAMVLGVLVDGAILVARANETSWQSARHAKRRLVDVGARILGAVLNNVDLDDRRSASYYQYYYYRSGYDEDNRKANQEDKVAV